MRRTGWFSLIRERVARRARLSRWSNRRRASWSVDCGSAAVESLESRCLLAAGDLDPSFGVGGVVTTNFGSELTFGRSVAIQADGKIVVAGSLRQADDRGFDFALARYNPDGSPDTSFDGDGRLTTDFGMVRDIAYGVKIQTDGKIVVAGESNQNFALARFNSDGSLDTSFGIDGKVTTEFGSSDFGYALAIQADGRIVVVGESNLDFALARYNSDGSLDTSFSGDGKVVTDGGPGGGSLLGIGLQANGTIIAAGTSSDASFNADFALARYDTNGSLDTSFDGDGKLTTDFSSVNEFANSVVVQPDGRIIVAGWSNGTFGVGRYNADGSLDTSFDQDGRQVITGGGGQGSALQTDGKIVVVGDGTNVFSLIRLNNDGSLDASFNLDGKVTTNLGQSGARAVALQADGNIIAAGFKVEGENSFFALARYLAETNQPAAVTSANAVSVPENTAAALTVTATDSENDALSFSIVSGEDGTLFSIGSASGELSFNVAPDFEIPSDADLDNVYYVRIRVSDGTNLVEQTIAVTVTDADEAPTITPVDSLNVPENSTAVLTVAAIDPENGTLTYSLAGGPDAALFAIGSASGELSFLAAPDFEHSADADRDNVYLVTVQVSDGSNAVTQDVQVTVTNVAEPITVTLPAAGGVGMAFLIGGRLHIRRSRPSPDLIPPIALDHVSAIVFQGSNRDDRLTLDRSLLAFSGSMVFHGGDGGDSLNARAVGVSVVFDGGNGNDTFLGGSGNDVADGGAGSDSLSGGGGNDTLNGGAGGDRLSGDVGNDVVSGGMGADAINGGTGNDSLNGDAGNDTLSGNDGADSLDGGDDDDRLFGGSGGDTLNGGAGTDRLSGDGDNDRLFGGSGNDSMNGRTGDDTLLGEEGRDTINGDAGNDVIDGGDDNDSLSGSDGDDSLRGGNGNDTLNGGNGNDLLTGSDGNDRLFGMSGDDTLLGDRGNDTLIGSTGMDTINPGPPDDHDIVTDGTSIIDTSFMFDFDALLAGL